VVVEIDGDAVQIHQAALVNHDRHAVELEGFVELGIDLRIKVELVLEAAAAAADDAHAQINLLRQIAVAGLLLVRDDPLDFIRRFFGYRNGHDNSSPFSNSETI